MEELFLPVAASGIFTTIFSVTIALEFISAVSDGLIVDSEYPLVLFSVKGVIADVSAIV